MADVLYEPISRSGTPESFGGSIIDQVQSMLSRGDRMGACKLAMENELWSHALILSNGFDAGLYRDTVLWFSRSAGGGGSIDLGDRLCLRVVYNLIGGSGPAAIDEFLPPFSEGNQGKYADTLLNWSGLLCMLLANPMDGGSLVICALGDRLREYGLVLSSQVWYVWCFYCIVIC